ncbi:hypothetical protein JAAARDRAFT_293500 [Jaapia argillacea MUCL 33604]|uniref:Uncharacterized protein n=1 Tax=Jaapia argillacea MUCL 33604 TaxID=933084 RepID=A0A067PRC3_9AGAM|nr:hypothetical protein JAAARDRAFT_293500 [Jaapia argillacea MUCL 33604]
MHHPVPVTRYLSCNWHFGRPGCMDTSTFNEIAIEARQGLLLSTNCTSIRLCPVPPTES